MATILAANTGNWSATGTWTGGVVPVAGDVVVANGKTVTVNQNVTVAELRNDTTGSATVGGSFTLTNGVVVNANVIQGATTTSCVQWSGTAGQSVTLTGTFTGGSITSAIAVSVTNNGSMTCALGSAANGGSGNAAHGIAWTSSGTLTFNGNATGGNTGGNNQGIQFNGTGSSLVMVGNVTGGSTGGGNGVGIGGSSQSLSLTGSVTGNTITGLELASTGSTGTITGTITAGIAGSQHGVRVNSWNTLTISGDIYGNTGANAYGIQVLAGAIVNITGNAFGHASQSSTYAVSQESAGTVNIVGSVTAGAVSAGARNNSTGILRLTRAIGNGYGVGSVGIGNVVAVQSTNQGALTYVEQLQLGSLGAFPVSGPIRLTANTGNSMQFTTTTGTTKTLVDTAATSGVLPAATDVRSGVVYSSGNITGTCAVPSANSVAYGVPVDNTTGNAVLTPANVRDAVGLASANLDTQLTNVNNTAIATSLMG